jgi:hypothetical protein
VAQQVPIGQSYVLDLALSTDGMWFITAEFYHASSLDNGGNSLAM